MPANGTSADETFATISTDSAAIRAGAGDDSVSYTYTGEGETVLQGGSGVDTLVLNFTLEDWTTLVEDVQADLVALAAWIADNTTKKGEVTGQWFDVTSLDLTVKQFEAIELYVDGVAVEIGDTTLPKSEDFTGGDANDVWNGTEGDETASGNGGNDRLNGDGLDLVLSFTDETSASVTMGGNDVINGGDGNDTITGDAPTIGLTNANYDGSTVIEGVTGSDTIFGGAGDDVINGDAILAYSYSENYGPPAILTLGNDVLDGGSGNDTIRGDAYQGNPSFSSLTFGDDTIDGGTGNDVLYGDDEFEYGYPVPPYPNTVTTRGADTFVFEADSGNDSIMDFDDGLDRIDVSALGFTGMADMGVTDLGGAYDIDLGGGNTLHVDFDDSSPSTTLTADDFIFA